MVENFILFMHFYVRLGHPSDDLVSEHPKGDPGLQESLREESVFVKGVTNSRKVSVAKRNSGIGRAK